uniref:Domain X domain-containing protein n=1 Tax=Placozoa sp. H17 HM-2017 TaxID=2017600 RepID=A0A7I6N4A4_9METZ|nr:hypothetical protein [Placozoa sp. H17 HM-2017]
MRPDGSVGSARPGFILEPLLFNIIFHEFDMYMEKLIRNIKKGGRKKAPLQPLGALKKSKLVFEGTKGPTDKNNRADPTDPFRVPCGGPIIKHLGYVRFAGSNGSPFLIGIRGPRSAIFKLKEQICSLGGVGRGYGAAQPQKIGSVGAHWIGAPKDTFWGPRRPSAEGALLSVNRSLDPLDPNWSSWDHNIVISSSDPKRNQQRFLGYIISQKATNKYKRGGGSNGSRMYFKMDNNIVITYLAKKGFCDGGGAPIPNFGAEGAGSLNSVLGLWALFSRYYHLANDKQQKLGRISYILKHSIAKYFAACFRLKTRRQVFKKIGGRSLTLFKPLSFGFRAPVGGTPPKGPQPVGAFGAQRSHSWGAFGADVKKYPSINSTNFFIKSPDIDSKSLGIVEGISVSLTNTGVFQIQTTLGAEGAYFGVDSTTPQSTNSVGAEGAQFWHTFYTGRRL